MKLSALISIVMLAGCLTMVSCDQDQSTKDNDAYIARNLLEHTIINENLKDELIRFNDRFKDYESAKGRGLSISISQIFPDSIVYDIGYSAGLNYEIPVLMCEPIDGKPVILELSFLWDEFKLPKRKAIELKKHASLKEYQMHKECIDHFEIVDGDTARTDITVLFDFVRLSLVYDRDHNLIRRDTIGWYK